MVTVVNDSVEANDFLSGDNWSGTLDSYWRTPKRASLRRKYYDLRWTSKRTKKRHATQVHYAEHKAA